MLLQPLDEIVKTNASIIVKNVHQDALALLGTDFTNAGYSVSILDLTGEGDRYNPMTCLSSAYSLSPTEFAKTFPSILNEYVTVNRLDSSDETWLGAKVLLIDAVSTFQRLHSQALGMENNLSTLRNLISEINPKRGLFFDYLRAVRDDGWYIDQISRFHRGKPYYRSNMLTCYQASGCDISTAKIDAMIWRLQGFLYSITDNVVEQMSFLDDKNVADALSGDDIKITDLRHGKKAVLILRREGDRITPLMGKLLETQVKEIEQNISPILLKTEFVDYADCVLK